MDGLIVAMLLSSAEYARFGCGTENSEAVSLRGKPSVAGRVGSPINPKKSENGPQCVVTQKDVAVQKEKKPKP